MKDRGVQKELIKNFLRVGDREPCSQAPPSFPSFAVFSFVHGEYLRTRVVDRLLHYNCSELGYITFTTHSVQNGN